MKLTLQIVITDESGVSRTEELMTLQKSGDARNDIGLSLSESKSLLNTRPAVNGSAAVGRIYLPAYPVPSLPCFAQNQRPAENTVQDTVWHYSCLRAPGVPVSLRRKCDKNRQSAQ